MHDIIWYHIYMISKGFKRLERTEFFFNLVPWLSRSLALEPHLLFSGVSFQRYSLQMLMFASMFVVVGIISNSAISCSVWLRCGPRGPTYMQMSNSEKQIFDVCRRGVGQREQICKSSAPRWELKQQEWITSSWSVYSFPEMQHRGKERTGQGKGKQGENGCVTSGELKMGRDITAFKKINY